MTATTESFPPQLSQPKGLQLLNWIADPIRTLERAEGEFGDTFVLNFPGRPESLVMLSRPDEVEQLLTANPKRFETGRFNGILAPLLGDYSMLLLDGPAHRRQRKLLLPPFHGDRMTAYGRLICDLARQLGDAWQPGETFVARKAMQRVTLQTILKAVFGLDEAGDRYGEIEPLLGGMLEALGSSVNASFLLMPALQKDWLVGSPWWQFLRRRAEADVLLYAEIADRRANFDPDRPDILNLMLSARDEAGEPMSDREIRDELMTLLIAGHETTASALAWALYWVHRQPEVAARLQAELDGLGDDPDPMAIVKLPYLNAVCQETLRIYPVGFLAQPRASREPATVGRWTFPANTMLFACVYLVHHREDLYPQADAFRPERFLERQYSPSEFLPFGGGSRACIGAAFAQFEMKLVLATLLRQWQFELREPRPLRPVRRGLTATPAGGVRMAARARRSSSRDTASPADATPVGA